MDKEWMRKALPVTPPPRFENWMHERMAEEFVEDMMLFSAERFRYEDEKGKKRSVWVTRCTCTACMEEFETRHIKPYAECKSFAMYQGEDGCLYPLDPLDGVTPIAEEEIDDFGIESGTLAISDGDQIECPWCGAGVIVKHRSKLRGGRTRQLLGCTVQNVWGYTAVICWLTARRWYEDGSNDLYTYPRDAYVIGERGELPDFGILPAQELTQQSTVFRNGRSLQTAGTASPFRTMTGRACATERLADASGRKCRSEREQVKKPDWKHT